MKSSIARNLTIVSLKECKKIPPVKLLIPTLPLIHLQPLDLNRELYKLKL